MQLDPQGQPANPYLNQSRRIHPNVPERFGLAEGMIADGTVTALSQPRIAFTLPFGHSK